MCSLRREYVLSHGTTFLVHSLYLHVGFSLVFGTTAGNVRGCSLVGLGDGKLLPAVLGGPHVARMEPGSLACRACIPALVHLRVGCVVQSMPLGSIHFNAFSSSRA